MAHPNDHEIQDVPDVGKVADGVLPDLDDLLDQVVDDVAGQDQLAGHHEVVERGHVAQQLHRSERQRRQHPARRGELEHDPTKSKGGSSVQDWE